MSKGQGEENLLHTKYSDIPTRGIIQDQLITLLTTAVVREEFDDNTLRRLVDSGQELEERFKQLLKAMSAPLAVSDSLAFLFDEISSLDWLMRQCRIVVAGPLTTAQFTDYMGDWLGETEYRIARPSEAISGSQVLELTAKLGYRGATLRETLCLLREYPDLMIDHLHLIAQGSSALRNSALHPCITHGSSQCLLSYWPQTRQARLNVDAFIIVKIRRSS